MERPCQKEGLCTLPSAAMQVYSDGSVSLCVCADFNADGGRQLGNVNDPSLKQMLLSERAKTCGTGRSTAFLDFANPAAFIGHCFRRASGGNSQTR
jgi:hypothetical protein